MKCDRCGSEMVFRGVKWIGKVKVYKYKCNSCGNVVLCLNKESGGD